MRSVYIRATLAKYLGPPFLFSTPLTIVQKVAFQLVPAALQAEIMHSHSVDRESRLWTAAQL